MNTLIPLLYLGLGFVEVCDHLADILAGFLIRDDDEAARLRIAGDDRFADGAVGVVLARGGGAGTTGRPALASGVARAALVVAALLLLRGR